MDGTNVIGSQQPIVAIAVGGRFQLKLQRIGTCSGAHGAGAAPDVRGSRRGARGDLFIERHGASLGDSIQA